MLKSLNKSLALGPNVSFQICNKLLPTWSSASTWAIVTISTSFELASSHILCDYQVFTRQLASFTAIKSSKRYGVSKLVREWVTSITNENYAKIKNHFADIQLINRILLVDFLLLEHGARTWAVIVKVSLTEEYTYGLCVLHRCQRSREILELNKNI